MKKIQELEDLKSKKVFLRVDFNVPLTQSSITNHQSVISDVYRIKAHKETINYLISAGARVALVSHADRSFRETVSEIGQILGYQLGFEEDILNPKLDSQLTLFENIRKYEGEEKNDEKLALSLSKGFDIYMNDAFSVSHRNHASVSGITKFLPSYAGFLMEKELSNLEKVLNSPAQGKTIVLGGAKISTKIPVIKNFLDKAEHILIAGALANAIFKFKGLKIGSSFVEDSEVENIDSEDSRIVLPKDFLISTDRSGQTFPEATLVKDLEDNQIILDIGPETAMQFSEIVKKSKMVIFNGPLGLAEVEAFSAGTKIVLDSIIRSGAFSVIGGGDTLALVEKLDLLDKFSYISTGGGAMLEFLAGDKLPGLEALGYYK